MIVHYIFQWPVAPHYSPIPGYPTEIIASWMFEDNHSFYYRSFIFFAYQWWALEETLSTSVKCYMRVLNDLKYFKEYVRNISGVVHLDSIQESLICLLFLTLSFLHSWRYKYFKVQSVLTIFMAFSLGYQLSTKFCWWK